MDETQLTQEILDGLKTGDKVEFKWYGSDLLCVGRIELNDYGKQFFVPEHNYSGDVLKVESMRFYNSLESYYNFTYFKVLSENN